MRVGVKHPLRRSGGVAHVATLRPGAVDLGPALEALALASSTKY